MLAFWAAVLVLPAVVVHRRHVAREMARLPPAIVREPSVPWLDEAAMARLGWLTPRFPRGRAPRCGPRTGALRVGAFGDSFTYGDEVADGGEYPAALEKALSRPGRPVEVYNFGVPGYGFHQAVLMWEAARAAGCVDAAVFFEHGFVSERDATFGPAWQHARFVLDGSGLRLIVPEGDTPEERRRLSLRFFLPLDRARHDVLPPAALAMWLPRGYTARNPLYYRADADAEAREVYARLARRLSESGMPVALVSYDPWIAELAPSTGSLWSVHVPQSYGAAYLAPGRHQSALGNRRVAAAIACALERRSPCVVPALTFSGVPAAGAAAAAGPPVLDAGSAGPVELAAHSARDGAFWHGAPVDGDYLLGLEKRWGRWLDAPLLALKAAPKPGARLWAAWTRDGRREEALIGEVVSAGPGLAVARSGWDIETWRREGLVMYPRRPEAGQADVVRLEDEVLLRRCAGGRALCPESGRYYTAHLPRADEAGPAGALRLAGRTIGAWRRGREESLVRAQGPTGSWLSAAARVGRNASVIP